MVIYGLFGHYSNFGESTSFSLVWALQFHSLGKGIKYNWKAGSVLEPLKRDHLASPCWCILCTFSFKIWGHGRDINFRAGKDLRVVPIFQMKTLRTKVVAVTIIMALRDEPGLSYYWVGFWWEGRASWVTPERGYDIMPWVVICKLHGCRDMVHLECASCMHTFMCLLIKTVC